MYFQPNEDEGFQEPVTSYPGLITDVETRLIIKLRRNEVRLACGVAYICRDQMAAVHTCISIELHRVHSSNDGKMVFRICPLCPRSVCQQNRFSDHGLGQALLLHPGGEPHVPAPGGGGGGHGAGPGQQLRHGC